LMLKMHKLMPAKKIMLNFKVHKNFMPRKLPSFPSLSPLPPR